MKSPRDPHPVSFRWKPRFADSFYAMHALRKKTRKTRQEDIDIASRRYRQISASL